jgi:hypothetical protein
MPSRIRIRLRYDRRADLTTVVALALLLCGLLVYLAWGREQAAMASANSLNSASTGSLRSYYLTKANFYGSQVNAANVCSSGYHFASLWEIAQTATLVYNTTLGQTLPDSGLGPQSGYTGWIRTGGPSSSAKADPPGEANCNTWTAGLGHYGTVASPQYDWSRSAANTFLGWRVITADCTVKTSAWCVLDSNAHPTQNVELPLIIR